MFPWISRKKTQFYRQQPLNRFCPFDFIYLLLFKHFWPHWFGKFQKDSWSRWNKFLKQSVKVVFHITHNNHSDFMSTQNSEAHEHPGCVPPTRVRWRGHEVQALHAGGTARCLVFSNIMFFRYVVCRIFYCFLLLLFFLSTHPNQSKLIAAHLVACSAGGFSS